MIQTEPFFGALEYHVLPPDEPAKQLEPGLIPPKPLEKKSFLDRCRCLPSTLWSDTTLVLDL
jgi:hypothetical protein